MSNYKVFITKHWGELLIAIITLLMLLIVFVPFFLNNSLDKFDTPGLLSLSWFIKEYTLPDFQGWNPYFFAGFPQGMLYPPLFHFLVALLGKIFHLHIAYKLVVTAAAVFIPYSIYEFSLRIFKEKPWAVLNTFTILIMLVLLPGYMGFNFDGLFDYGLGPSFVTIPMFFFYLAKLFDKKPKVTNLAIIFSIMLLTNLVATLVAGLITASYFGLKLKHEKRVFARLASFALISFFLTAFWTIPYLVFRQYTASGYHMTCNKVLSLTSFAAILITMMPIMWKRAISNKIKLLSISLPTIIISALCLTDTFLNANVTNISIPFIHIFRLQIFTFLPIAILFVNIIKTFHPIFIKIVNRLRFAKFITKKWHISLNLTSAIFVLFLCIIIRLNPSGVEEVKFDNIAEWDGRIIRAYKVTEVLDQSRAVIDKSVISNKDDFAVDGLLKESSYLAPYFQSFSKSLNPNNFDWDKLDQFYIENKQVPEKKVEFLANLLWVKSVLTIDNNFPKCTNYNPITSFTTNSKDQGVIKRDMYICLYSPSKNSELLEPLSTEPKVVNTSWDKKLDTWWLSDDQKLFTNKELATDLAYEKEINLNYDFSANFQELTITSDSDKKVPVLVKVSYFQKWKAYNKDGSRVEIYRISPNLMALPVEEEVTLKYERTIIEWLTLGISSISWVIVLLSPLLKERCKLCVSLSQFK